MRLIRKRKRKSDLEQLFGKRAEAVYITEGLPENGNSDPLVYLTLADHKGQPLYSRPMSLEEASALSGKIDRAVKDLGSIKHQEALLAMLLR